MADATYLRAQSPHWITVAAAALAGELRQGPDGRAYFLNTANGAASGDASVKYQDYGHVTVTKASGIVILDGGPVYWDRSARAAHYKMVDDQDFLAGSAVGDAASTDTSMTVKLNVHPTYTRDLIRDTFTPALLGTPAESIMLRRRGGWQMFVLDATNEAQKADALSDDGFSTIANAIFEAKVKVLADDSGTAAKFSLGLASATHATAWTSIANSIGIQLTAHDLKIYAASKTGSVTVAPTDTTVAYVVGTWFEVWIDTRNPAACAIYINGVRVLSATVFDISACVSTLYMLAHLVKTATADTEQVLVRDVRARLAEQ